MDISLPVTKNLVEYIHGIDMSACDIIRRGVPRDCVYRMLAMKSHHLSPENTIQLARALGIGINDLLSIATGADRSKNETIGRALPAVASRLIDAWPDLCPVQKAKIEAYIDGVLDTAQSKNVDQKTA